MALRVLGGKGTELLIVHSGAASRHMSRLGDWQTKVRTSTRRDPGLQEDRINRATVDRHKVARVHAGRRLVSTGSTSRVPPRLPPVYSGDGPRSASATSARRAAAPQDERIPIISSVVSWALWRSASLLCSFSDPLLPGLRQSSACALDLQGDQKSRSYLLLACCVCTDWFGTVS